MGSLFNDILGRAEKLSTINYQEQIGTEPSPSDSRVCFFIRSFHLIFSRHGLLLKH